ncbi:FMN-binding domain-containing protein [Oribacterium sp. KHPX15]|uniref:FMN-binding protein n=1 Tax=Oribacterium sp. KHPX15 TaxID=1855342 RepID=UPI00089BD272|nr:FMN-binding protein [Oribacterium sp. KHPX15]SEA73969.1 FMN-binding domain-containing protein [Oribacterium sp. KHPX15]
MKKLVMMTATAGLMLALSACGSTSAPEATTAAAQETTVAAEETTAAAEETTAAAEETTAAAEETTAAAEETTAAAEETTAAAEETTAAAEETTAAAEETTAAAEETTAAAEEEGTTLTGTAKGFGGDVTVTLTMDGDKIVKASIEGKDETPNVGGAALADLEKQIVDAGSDEIDGVSGATITSTGVKEAVKAALAK